MVAKSCPTLSNPIDCSMPGSSVLRYLPEFAQIHVHCVGHAISHLILYCPLLLLPSISPSIKVFFNNLTLPIRWLRHSELVFPINNQHWFLLGLTGLSSFLSKGISSLSSTTIQKHQFFGAQTSLWVQLTSIQDYLKNHSFVYMELCWQSDVSTS